MIQDINHIKFRFGKGRGFLGFGEGERREIRRTRKQNKGWNINRFASDFMEWVHVL